MGSTVKVILKESISMLKTLEGKTFTKFEGTKEGFTPALCGLTGILKTGLTPQEEKDFEEALGLPEKTLRANSSYWDSFFINIPAKGLTLNLGNPVHQLYHKLFLADPYTANSIEDSKRMSRCHYILVDEEVKAKEENVQRKNKVKAYSLFEKLSKEDIINILYLYGFEASSTSPEFNENKLANLMEANYKLFIDYVEDPNKELKIFITKACSAGIVTKSGNSAGMEVPLFYRENALGLGLSEAVIFLKDKANQNIFLAIKKELKEYYEYRKLS